MKRLKLRIVQGLFLATLIFTPWEVGGDYRSIVLHPIFLPPDMFGIYSSTANPSISMKTLGIQWLVIAVIAYGFGLIPARRPGGTPSGGSA